MVTGLAAQSNQSIDNFIGFGNPEADILIVGKEVALDPVYTSNGKLDLTHRDSKLYEIEARKNVLLWNNNLRNKISFPSIQKIVPPGPTSADYQNDMTLWCNGTFNPLWPYYELPRLTNIPTWESYQEICDRIFGPTKTNVYDFWQSVFVTEMSAFPLCKSRGANYTPTKNSINNRIQPGGVLDDTFFKGFKYYIFACSKEYLTADAPFDRLERIFGVMPKCIDAKKFNCNSRVDTFEASGRRLIFVTRQLSNSYSRKILDYIASIILGK